MRRKMKGKQILAWLLILLMTWQNAGLEAMAASVETVSSEVDSGNDFGAEGENLQEEESAEEEQEEDEADEDTSDETDAGLAEKEMPEEPEEEQPVTDSDSDEEISDSEEEAIVQPVTYALDEEYALQIWQEASGEKTSLGGAQTFAEAKSLLTETEGEDLLFTIEVAQEGMTFSGSDLDFRELEGSVSIAFADDIPEEDASLTAAGTVTLGGKLQIKGNISAENAELLSKTNEDGTSSEIKLEGDLKLTGTLLLNGRLWVQNLSVAKTTTAYAQQALHIGKSGTLSALTIKGDGNEIEKTDTFRIYLDKTEDTRAVLNLGGNVTRTGSMEYPVTFEPEEGTFAVGEKLAKVTNEKASVPLEYFYIQNDAQCVTKENNELKVSGAAVRLQYGTITRTYPTLETAVKAITTATSQNGFGSQKGTYDLTILQDYQIGSGAVTFPTCVTGLKLSGQKKSEETEDLEQKPLVLDLNAQTITAAGVTSVSLGSGLTLQNGTLLAVNADFKIDSAALEDAGGKLEFTKWNLSAKTFGFSEDHAGAALGMNALTLNSGSMSVDCELTLHTLTLKDSRLYVDAGAKLEVSETVTVSSAYARDTGSQYYTIENNGGTVHFGTLNMTAGTLYNGPAYLEDGSNGASLTIDTVTRVVNLYNDEGAVFTTHRFNQTAKDKVRLFDQSEFRIEDKKNAGNGEKEAGSALIYNLVQDGSPVIQKSSAAKLYLYGTPSRYQNSEDRCTVRILLEEEETLKDADLLLYANVSAFPTDLFRAVGQSFKDDLDGQKKVVETGEFLLYQSGMNIRINHALFVLYREGIVESSYLGSYASWGQLSAAITAMNDTTADYTVKVNPGTSKSVDIGGTFVLPSKAKSICFDYETEEDEEEPELCSWIYQGGLNLTINVTFRNIWLQPKAVSKNPKTLTLNAKTLTLENSIGAFASVTGKSGSTLVLSGGSHLDADGMVTLYNVRTNGTDNKISYGGNNEKTNMLIISGNVTGEDVGIAWTENENGDERESLYYKKSAITVVPKALDANYSGQKLLRADQVQAVWFVTLDAEGNKQCTTKSGKYIYGAVPEKVNAVHAVRLEMANDSDEVYAYYATVQEAFTAIDTLNNKQMTYRVILEDSSAASTFATADLTFPSKAKKLYITSGEKEGNYTFQFKSKLTLNCETEFDGLALYTPAGSLNLGTYRLTLSDCHLYGVDTKVWENETDRKAKLTAVSGNSKSKKAELILDNTELDIAGDVKDLNRLEVSDRLETTGSITGITNLVMGCVQDAAAEYVTTVTAQKTISVQNVVTNHDKCEIAAGVTLTRDKSAIISNMVPGLTISGTLSGQPVTVRLLSILFYDTDGYVWGSAYKTNQNGDEETPSYAYRGIRLANAKNVSADMIRTSTENTKDAEDGVLYKSGGYITYRSVSDYAVTLCYQDTDGSSAETPCLSLSDAVAEINNLSKARDYRIVLRKDIGTNETVTTPPVKFTLPSKGKAATVTITSEAEEKPCTIYYQGNITASTGLKLENVNLVQKVSKKVGKVTSWYLPENLTGYYSAGVTIQTAYGLTLAEGVGFDKHTPVLLDGSKSAGSLTIAADASVTVQKVNAFKTLTVNGTLNVVSYPVSASKQAGGTISVKNLTLNGAAEERSGCMVSSEGAMTISGNVVSSGKGNVLASCRASAASAPTLKIQGTVTLKDGNRIKVRVNDTKGNPIILGSSQKLLSAAKASADQFEPDTECLAASDQDPYQWQAQAEEGAAQKNGYILQKVGSDIHVYYASSITASVYREETLVGYYVTLADAVNAVNAQKDKTKDYSIVLLKNAGGDTTSNKPLSLTLPTTKAKVTITSEQGQNYTIYYTNELTLKSNLELRNVTLAPMALAKNKKSYTAASLDIKAGGYNLYWAGTVASGSRIRNLSGTGTLKAETDLNLAGTLNVQGLWIPENAAVTSSGNLTVKKLTMDGSGILTGKAAMSIGAIVVGANGEPTIHTFRTSKNASQLSVTGKTASSGAIVRIVVNNYQGEVDNYALTYPSSGYQVSVPSTKKLADIKAEYLSYFNFAFADAQLPEKASFVKYNGGVYYTANEKILSNTVRLSNTSNDTETSLCLDLSQAAAEIKNLAETAMEYQVTVSGAIGDTNVTDKAAYSAFTFPAANTCRSVTYTAQTDEMPGITFLADSGWKPVGEVRLKGLKLQPVSSKGKTASVAVAMSRSGKYVQYPSALTLENCSMGTISTVTGVKNVSVLCLKNTDLQINSTVNNMNLLEASNSHLITLGTVTVNTVRLNDSEKKAVKWDAFGATTIASSLKTDSFVNTDSFIATNRLAKTQTKPNFVLNGSASTAGTPFYFKVYASGVKSASVIANAEGIYRSAYEDQALLIAPKANADKFRAAAFRNDSDTSYADIISYKDLNYSVMNGKKSSMAVELTRYEGGTATSLTYAKSFAQAVTLIDAVNDTKSSYVMTLLNNSEVLVSNNGKTHVRTAQSSGKPIYGSLVLPTKAASVTVRGEAGSDLTIAYTGKLTPKCNITFENISLLEGSVNNKKNWTVSKEHAPNVDLGSGKYTLGLPGNEKVNGYSSLTAKSGTISLADAVTVSGAINVKNLTILKNAALKASGTLTVSGDTKVYSKAAITGNSTMTFGNIVPAENNAALSITTRRTAITKKSTVSKTQLTINGQVNADTSIQMMVYDTSVSGSYRPADAEDEDVFLLAEGAVPTDAAKVAVIPKASLEHISVLLNGETPLTWKYGKGLYLTDAAYLPISVSGYSGGTQVYEASFMTWAQAVAEIDSLNTSGRDYTIKLYESIGNNGSIGTLTMPTKAKSLTITSENDNVTDNGRAIFFTGTTITLKCPTEFSKIGLVSVKKKTGGKLTWYDSQSYKITAGSYNLKMTDMMRGGDYYYGSGESHEWLTASLSAITGNAKATFTYAQTNRRYQKNESTGYESWSSGTFQTAIAGQVTGFGTVSLKRSLDADGKPFDEKSYADVYISGGISGITTLNVDSNVNLIVKNGNVTTKNARIDGTVTARNFTSTGTLTMSKGCIDVSGYVKNTVTGAVKLNNLVLLSMDNQIFGRWNKSNQSQIVISGTISTSKGYDTVFSADLTEHVPLFVGLTYYTRAGYVQLYSGLLLLQSTKTSAAAANTLFAPWYSTNTTQGMGQKPQTDGAYLYKLVKSGKSNLIYQRTAK